MSERTREDWLAERRELITASDAGAILEMDPTRGPLRVFIEKVHGVEPEDAPWMRRGRRFEAPIAEEYAEVTGRPVDTPDPYAIVRHPAIQWLGATLDRITTGSELCPAPAEGHAPLELKNVSGLKASEWRDEAPTHYLAQVQIQIACTGWQWASLAALVGGMTLAWRDVPRHERFLAAALPRLEAFRLRVQRREPPEADGLPGTTAALKALYSIEDGETETLDQEALRMADDLDSAKAREKAAATTVRELKNKLLRRIGSATFGALPDGSLLTLKTQGHDGYEVREKECRVLRRVYPRLRRRA